MKPNYPMMGKMPTRPKPLTEEEKKTQALKAIANKREQYALNILCNLCQSTGASRKAEDLPDVAVKMAEKLLDLLFFTEAAKMADEKKEEEGE